MNQWYLKYVTSADMHRLNLQLREQLQICTGFPFNPIATKAIETKIQSESNTITVIPRLFSCSFL
jgi:hypothetical protein